MEEIFFVLILCVVVWYWWDTQKSNEIALFVCRQKCEKAAVQLLDATVTRQRSWLRRDNNGRVQICRLYSFEYSDGQVVDYGRREQGYIVLIGKQVVETGLPAAERSGRQLH